MAGKWEGKTLPRRALSLKKAVPGGKASRTEMNWRTVPGMVKLNESAQTMRYLPWVGGKLGERRRTSSLTE